MGGNSTPEEFFNLNDLRVELLQSIYSGLGRLLVICQKQKERLMLFLESEARNLLLSYGLTTKSRASTLINSRPSSSPSVCSLTISDAQSKS